MLQPTSRRFLRELDEAPGGNNLQYILQCSYVPVSPFFGNQSLHNEIVLGGNGRCSGVTPYKRLGKISDNLHPNNQNNWLERRAQLP